MPLSKWLLGKRRWYLVLAVVTVSVVIVAAVVNHELVAEHMYPEDAIYEDSNVTLRGIVTSFERNYKSQGYMDYHIFRFFIVLNITEVVWVGGYGAGSVFSDGSRTVIGVGYDYLDDPQFSVGQVVECRGFYLPILESPHSYMITVAPSVSGSYVELQG